MITFLISRCLVMQIRTGLTGPTVLIFCAEGPALPGREENSLTLLIPSFIFHFAIKRESRVLEKNVAM